MPLPETMTRSLLLVEDDRVDQMAFSRMIRDESLPYHLKIAGSIGDARSLIGMEQIDVAVCDVYLGDGTVFDILPAFRDAKIPVIVVSGAEDEASAADVVRRGAHAYIVKDQNYNYLKALPLAIERALGHVPADHAQSPAPPAVPGTFVPATAEIPAESDEVHFRRFVIDPSELVARYRPDGTILFVNDAYCRFVNRSRSDLIGQRSEPLLSAEDQAALARARSGLQPRSPASVSEFRVSLPGGPDRWIRRTDRALFNEQGLPIEFQMVATDITEQKLAQEALRESEERYRMLAEHAFDGILIQDLAGTILYINQSVLRMFGFRMPEEVVGKNTLSFIAPESREAAAQDLLNVSLGRQGYIQKYRALTSDGTEIFVESVGTLIPYQGKTANIVALRDVTERELATLRLQRELERKRDFINVAAHELRTPLQPVIGYLDLLMDGSLGFSIPPEVAGILKKVRANVEAERHMVNQILELSLLESIHEKMYWPEMTEVNIRELAGLVIHQGKYADEAAIAIEIPENLSVVSNGPYIHEILDALLSNAVTYSDPPRSITVHAEEAFGGARISVTDNGTGIPPERLEDIFDPFFISDADKLSRKYGRLGVGLTMARARATRLGGTLTVRSTPGSGSTFTLTLPRGEAE